jgi:hypothetical protein
MRRLLNEYHKLKEEHKSVENELSTYIEGKLQIKGDYYYHKIGSYEKSISKEPIIIRQLARKRFLKERVKQINTVFEYFQGKTATADTRNEYEIINSFPLAYKTLPPHYFFHPKVVEWLDTKYKQKNYSHQKSFYTKNGVVVRSKSERSIGDMLEDLNLVYRYDSYLNLGFRTISPDFIVKNPFNNNTVTIEHFGLLNDEAYVKSMDSKMTLYRSAGYVLNENLIYTFEPDIENLQRLKETIIELLM